MTDPQPIKPQPKQNEFLKSAADVALYGGAAGGGKSFSLLLAPIRHLANPQFKAVIFRRTTTDITKAGALWDESQAIYYGMGGKPNKKDLKWVFPSGASITFAHLEHESTVYRWQGGQITMLIFDELTHFSAEQFWYMLSRTRSVSGIKTQIRMSTNPDKDSWVRKMVNWWIGKDGYAIAERSGVIRYFLKRDDEIIWADSSRALGEGSMSFTFVPASLDDNKILTEADPTYKNNLLAQNVVERQRLLEGNWNVSWTDFGTVIDTKKFTRYYHTYKTTGEIHYPVIRKAYFVMDSASKINDAADYTVIGLFVIPHNEDRYYIYDWHRERMLMPDAQQKLIDMWEYWHKQIPISGIWIEDKSLGTGIIQHLQKAGLPVYELKAIKDKFSRINDVLWKINTNRLYIPAAAPWVNNLIEECDCFRADMNHVVMYKEKKPHDDQVDVIAYGLSDQIDGIIPVQVYTPVSIYKKQTSRFSGRPMGYRI